MAYPQNIPQTERHLVLGLFPREIHFHVRRYPVASLPRAGPELQSWCQERWAEKEERLRAFYTGARVFDASRRSRIPPCKTERRVMVIKAASLLYWSVFIALCFAGLYLSPLLRAYFLVMVLFYFGQQRALGGLELAELACHRHWSGGVGGGDGEGEKGDSKKER